MWSLQPLFLISFFFVSIIAVRIFHQQSISIHFSLGLLLGTVTDMLTSLLNCLILLFCGNAEWSLLAISVFLAHLPLAALEGVIVGVIVMYLQVTKSQLLPFHNVQRGNNSSNGISH
jgi:ABC-type Co2+ transport system permease subunit